MSRLSTLPGSNQAVSTRLQDANIGFDVIIALCHLLIMTASFNKIDNIFQYTCIKIKSLDEFAFCCLLDVLTVDGIVFALLLSV